MLYLYRTYRSVRYRCSCRIELSEVSGTGNTGGIYRRYASVRAVVPNTPLINWYQRYFWWGLVGGSEDVCRTCYHVISKYPTQLAKLSFDEILDVKTGVFYFLILVSYLVPGARVRV